MECGGRGSTSRNFAADTLHSALYQLPSAQSPVHSSSPRSSTKNCPGRLLISDRNCSMEALIHWLSNLASSTQVAIIHMTKILTAGAFGVNYKLLSGRFFPNVRGRTCASSYSAVWTRLNTIKSATLPIPFEHPPSKDAVLHISHPHSPSILRSFLRFSSQAPR
jgi:hypothetical protein